MSGVDREKWWPEGAGRHEVTFAIAPFIDELRLYDGPRDKADEWKKQFDARLWLTGTIDWLGLLFGPGCLLKGTRWVDDLKTGAWPVDVKTSKQLRSYALVPWMMDLMPDDWECIVSITQWPRYPLGAEPVRTWDRVTSWELEEHLQDVRHALEHPNQLIDPQSFDEESDKLHSCSGCECREPIPASAWMQNFWYRAAPQCWPGMIARVNHATRN